jgi:hypothetical protein
MNTQTPQQLGRSLHSALFATPDNISAAYDQALQIANASENAAAVMTAVQLVVNAIAQELMTMQQSETNEPNNVRERNDD